MKWFACLKYTNFHYLISFKLAFLKFNWQPSKIFMGDIGSTFLGLIYFSAILHIDNLEDPVGTLRDSGYPDPDVLDFPSGGNYRKGSDVLDRLIDLELVKGKKNQNMTSLDKSNSYGNSKKS